LFANKSYVETAFGPEFMRAWEFYLSACEQGFLHQGLTVYQLLIGHRPDSAPLSRSYMLEAEAQLRGQGLPPELAPGNMKWLARA